MPPSPLESSSKVSATHPQHPQNLTKEQALASVKKAFDQVLAHFISRAELSAQKFQDFVLDQRLNPLEQKSPLIHNLNEEEVQLFQEAMPLIFNCKRVLQLFSDIPFSQENYRLFQESCWGTVDALVAITNKCKNPKLTEKIQRLFRGEIFEFFTQSKLFSRCFAKPFGYPGDYIMLQGLYNNEIISSSNIGKYFDQIFLNDPLSKAVINRVNTMSEKLQKFLDTVSKDDVHILNIASGSGFELLPIAKKCYSKTIHIHCFDQEVSSLIFLSEKLKRINQNIQFHFYREDIKEFFKKGAHKQRFDYIYNIGLADYLPERILRNLMQESIDALAPGGKFVLAHKDYLLFPYQYQSWPCDWHFVHRSPEDMRCFISQNLGNYKEYDIFFESNEKIVYFMEFVK